MRSTRTRATSQSGSLLTTSTNASESERGLGRIATLKSESQDCVIARPENPESVSSPSPTGVATRSVVDPTRTASIAWTTDTPITSSVGSPVNVKASRDCPFVWLETERLSHSSAAIGVVAAGTLSTTSAGGVSSDRVSVAEQDTGTRPATTITANRIHVKVAAVEIVVRLSSSRSRKRCGATPVAGCDFMRTNHAPGHRWPARRSTRLPYPESLTVCGWPSVKKCH